ncbi:hypothetical protein SEVIR_3G416300v4 [Setaria viridis]|uniref:Ubiquitin-like domain-containing protein n=1 Tax=Setaria viridis TaxID=4556 RepID=A0A4U6VPR9_SETVI|nr:uncharacterized protein LOC117847862 [Setaria viridis]TKW29749.1 hypothetical protein SEVIR_3G416300v2 [Setaria viridis]
MSTVTCEVEPSCAATAGGERATKFGGKVGVPPREPQRRLLFAVAGKGKGRRLGDGRGGGSALAGFYWYGNLLLGLRRRGGADGGGGSMQVFVRTPAGSTLALDVSPSDTVGEVKARIQARERVAAGQQRLVFAGRHLDDGRRTLADYGVGKEANLHLLLRLRGGLAGGHTNTGTAAAIGNPHWMTTVGLLATVVAVGAVLHCCFPPSASCCGGLGGAMLAVAVAGVNLITAGVCLTRAPAAESLSRMARFVLSRAAAFPRRDVAVLGVAAATGIFVGDAQAQPVLSFVCFALFLVSMAVVTIGIASSTR